MISPVDEFMQVRGQLGACSCDSSERDAVEEGGGALGQLEQTVVGRCGSEQRHVPDNPQPSGIA